jgi:AcrR family transcriptional regulator
VEAQQKAFASNGLDTDTSEIAERVLDAAKRLLAERGWRALTVSEICREAGVYRAAINYHFGSKDGLFAALLDSLIHEFAYRVMVNVMGLSSREERIRQTVQAFSMLGGRDVQVAFFEAFPHLLRDETFRTRLKRVYADAMAIIAVSVGGSHALSIANLDTFSSLALAVADGLVIQQLVDIDKDAEPVITMFAALLTPVVEQLIADGQRATPAARG